MRFEVRINGNQTYSVYDHLFGRSDTYDNFDDARRMAAERNHKHIAEINELERQFL